MQRVPKENFYRICPGFADVLRDWCATIPPWEHNNPFGLPQALCDVISQIEVLYGAHTKMQMFESYGEAGPPVVAEQKPVPLEARREMKHLAEKAAELTREAFPGSEVVIVMPDHFVE